LRIGNLDFLGLVGAFVDEGGGRPVAAPMLPGMSIIMPTAIGVHMTAREGIS